MSVSHHNVTCTTDEWAASNTFSMIANYVREGIPDLAFHGPHVCNFSG